MAKFKVTSDGAIINPSTHATLGHVVCEDAESDQPFTGIVRGKTGWGNTKREAARTALEKALPLRHGSWSHE